MRLIAPAARVMVGVLCAASATLHNRPSFAADPSSTVARHNDIVFAEVDGHKLLLDLSLPTRTNEPPLVVYIHGGSWMRGSRKECPVNWLAEEGYAVASISYRFTDRAIFPAQIHDCKGAIRWLRAHARQYGYDATRISVAGSSAGGHLAVLLGTSGGVKELEGGIGGNAEQSSKVAAVVDFYGPTDFVLRSRTQPDRANKPGSSTFGLLGGPASEKLDLARLASGVSHVSADDPPLLVFHGDQDRTVMIDQSERLRDAYMAANLDVSLHTVRGAGHGGEAFSTKETRRLVKEFCDSHLRTQKPKTER